MPPRAKKAAAPVPPVDDDQGLANVLNDPEADAAVDELDDATAAKLADEEYGGPDDELPPPGTEPAAAAADPAPAGSPSVLESHAAPLEPAKPLEVPTPVPPPPANPDGDVLGFVTPAGEPLDVRTAIDMSGADPLVPVLADIEMSFRPPNVLTPMQQLRHRRGEMIPRSLAASMIRTQAAVDAALGLAE